MLGVRDERLGGAALLQRPDVVPFAHYLADLYARAAVVRIDDTPSAAAFAAGGSCAQSIAVCDVGGAPPEPALLDAFAAAAVRGALLAVTGDRHRDGESELRESLLRAGLRPAFTGRTLCDNFMRERDVALAVVDVALGARLNQPPAPPVPRPLAVIATYNDADVIAQLARRHLASGLDLHFVDNWSTDGTYELLLELAAAHAGRVEVERWPAGGAVAEYRWTQLLDRKAEIGSRYPGRWIVHIDSDELWRSPWPDRTLAEAFGIAQSWGANAVGASMFTFVPTRDGFGPNDDPVEFFDRFMYAPHDSYDELLRAWRQPEAPIDLSSSGGHVAKFPDRTIFPYRFPLFHYPFRSERQGLRKVVRDRLPRFLRAECERGWHVHYMDLRPGERFVSYPDLLHRFDPAAFDSEYLLERLSDIVMRRRNGSLLSG